MSVMVLSGLSSIVRTGIVLMCILIVFIQFCWMLTECIMFSSCKFDVLCLQVHVGFQNSEIQQTASKSWKKNL